MSILLSHWTQLANKPARGYESTPFAVCPWVHSQELAAVDMMAI